MSDANTVEDRLEDAHFEKEMLQRRIEALRSKKNSELIDTKLADAIKELGRVEENVIKLERDTEASLRQTLSSSLQTPRLRSRHSHTFSESVSSVIIAESESLSELNLTCTGESVITGGPFPQTPTTPGFQSVLEGLDELDRSITSVFEDEEHEWQSETSVNGTAPSHAEWCSKSIEVVTKLYQRKLKQNAFQKWKVASRKRSFAVEAPPSPSRVVRKTTRTVSEPRSRGLCWTLFKLLLFPIVVGLWLVPFLSNLSIRLFGSVFFGSQKPQC